MDCGPGGRRSGREQWRPWRRNATRFTTSTSSQRGRALIFPPSVLSLAHFRSFPPHISLIFRSHSNRCLLLNGAADPLVGLVFSQSSLISLTFAHAHLHSSFAHISLTFPHTVYIVCYLICFSAVLISLTSSHVSLMFRSTCCRCRTFQTRRCSQRCKRAGFMPGRPTSQCMRYVRHWRGLIQQNSPEGSVSSAREGSLGPLWGLTEVYVNVCRRRRRLRLVRS